SSYRSLALLHLSMDQDEKALQYLYEGLDMAEMVGALSLKSSIVQILFDYFDGINRVDSALKYHKLLKEYEEQINKEETLRELTRLELTARFQEEELLRNLDQKRREQRYAFVGGLLLMVAVIAGLLYFLAHGRARRLKLLNVNIQLESQNTSLRLQNLEKELEVKNKELTTNVMYQIRKNELVNEISKKLIALKNNLNKENQERVLGIVKELEKTQDESVWNEFELHFQQVHNDFYEKLHSLNPELTLNERRLCAFLRLNMTTKEISAITGQSLRSIEVARTRLRKKLHLTNSDVHLTEFLLSI
ncbi:MAG: helix-turn-helix transcriptional regulator, partial [Bacteroidota bacterium]